MNNVRQLIDELRLNKCSIKLNGSDSINLLFEDNVQLPDDLIEKIRKNKAAIIEYLKSSLQTAEQAIQKVPLQKSYPISDAQRRLWVLSQFEESSVAYNMPESIQLSEDIDIECFRKAIYAVIDRHEILRTVFREDENGEVRQWILNTKDLGFEIYFKDLRNEHNRLRLAQEYIKQDSFKLFDLEKGPLLRAALLQTENNEYVFYFNMQHIIGDGWSMDVLSKDVLEYYEAYKQNKLPQLKELRIQYKDYAVWQLEQLKEEAFKAHRSYWLDCLKGELPLLDLPCRKQRPRVMTNNGVALRAYINKETSKKLKEFALKNGGTVFMGLLATLNATLYRYTGQEDLVIGTPVAGRDHADLENQIGFYVNTLALRTGMHASDNFNQLFARVKQTMLNAYTHQMYPFDRLVEELKLARDTSRSAVFDVMLTLQNAGEKIQTEDLDDLTLNNIQDLGYSAAKFDLDINFQETGDYLSLHVTYNTDVYDKHTIEAFIDHYRQLLNLLLDKSSENVSQTDYLSVHEKHELLQTFNNTHTEYPKDKTITDLFDEQLAKNQDTIAVVFEETKLTYRELDAQANQLAHYLKKQYKIKPDDLVAIKLNRSEWMIITILAILKAGGAYVPIDPEYPQDRIEYIEQDTNCRVCIDDNELNNFRKEQTEYSTKKIISETKAHNLAYVIYTSGSTGKPKGVMIEHRNVVRLFKTDSDLFDFNSTDAWTMFHSYSFDFSVWEMYGALLFGGKLVVVSKITAQDTGLYLKLLEKENITILNQTPSAFYNLSKEEQNLPAQLKIRYVIFGGEALSPGKLKYWYEHHPACKLINMYGITETTVHTTYKQINEEEITLNRSNIGKPIPTVSCIVLDKNKNLVPAGVEGELYVGGEGLARGYLNRETLTNERFIPNPFLKAERLYKTGDKAIQLKNGDLEYLGRTDDQVKIRGFRIELGEIEFVLQNHKAIDLAVVIARENESKEKELVAYITAKEEQNITGLRSYLKTILPEYMIPSYFVQLETLPLTSNGKVNKKSLPAPQGLELKSGVDYVAPRTKEENVLVMVWEDVLKRETISVKENFYNLGGDSIKSIQVVSRLKQKGYALKVEHLLRTPVLEELSLLIRQNKQVTDQAEVRGLVELTPIQKWFFENPVIKNHNHYNQSIVLKSKEPIDKIILKKCIADLTRQHDALRMVYKKNKNGWEQTNQDIETVSGVIDFFDLTCEANAPEQMSEIGEQLQSGIDITKGALFRIGHFRLKDGDRLALIIHHLIVDGVSWRILLEDLLYLYKSYKQNKAPGLPAKTDSFQQWALLQKEYVQSNKAIKERAYWEEMCNQHVESLPKDKTTENPVITADESFHLNKDLTELLQTQVHKVYRSEINDILLACLGLAVKDVFKIEKVAIKLEGHGRENITEGTDISRTVGWFTSMFPFVLNVSGATDQAGALVEVKEALRKLPRKGIGFGILKYLSDTSIKNKLNPEIVFNYLGDFGKNAGESGDDVLFDYASENIGTNSSKENGEDCLLDISGILVMGELNISIKYPGSVYDSKTIKKLSASYKQHLISLIEELAGTTNNYLTPSDLTFRGLSKEELQKINSDNSLEDVYELSPLQEGIYYHWLAEDSSSLYFEQMSYKVRTKELNAKTIKHAYNMLIARHGVLRTSFSTTYAGRSLQIVRKTVPDSFTFEELEKSAGKNNYIEEIKRKDREKGFDLNNPSQMRLHVVDLQNGQYEFIWSHHHILMDGWCMSILLSDFNQLLIAESEEKTPALAPSLPYSNYINWLQEADRDDSLNYWKTCLSGYTQVAEIPFKLKTEGGTYQESKEPLQIDGELFKKINNLCNETGITHNTFIQGAWGYLLSQYNNVNDVVFGSVVSGRPAELPGVEEMVGLFINTIPVRVKYKPQETALSLLKNLHDQFIQGTSHHYTSLSKIQSASEAGINLINHIMIFENYAVKEIETRASANSTLESNSIYIESVEIHEQTNYDFNIIIAPAPDSLNINITYNSKRYNSSSVNLLKNHFYTLIRKFAENTNHQLNTFQFLSPEEKHELLFTFNNTTKEYSGNKTLINLFEEQVIKTPDNTAIVFEERMLTYRELNEHANQLARYLQNNYQIVPDDLIGIKINRSEWMLISILGILKSGGAYVPIDPNYPQDRISYILSDSSCKTVIDTQEIARFESYKAKFSTENLMSAGKPENLAYVIYTSGSTGKPKGVMVEHKNLVSTFLNCNEQFGFDRASQFAATTNFTFDISVLELLAPLTTGAKIILLDINDPQELLDKINYNKFNFLQLTPSRLQQLLEIEPDAKTLQKLSTLLIGGEALNQTNYNLLKKLTGVRVIQAYGPTETTIWSTTSDITESHKLSIGKPLLNERIYILNSDHNLVPVGIVGEICIGGEGVTRGYLNNKTLTDEKFMQDPFRKDAVIYKTGDYGKWLEDGNIEFSGRKDDQVKIRGFRIELGEVENALIKDNDIDEAVVLAKENNGVNKLIAFIVSKTEPDIDKIRQNLKDHLPDYMLPASYVHVKFFPLTHNGKIDRKALLKEADKALNTKKNFIEPRNQLEEKLVKIWSETLGTEKIGITENFFELGGNSLVAIKIMSRIQNEFNLKIKWNIIFQDPNIETLAKYMDAVSPSHDQTEDAEKGEELIF
ncbi:MAG: amino acid adenylation domain-containing protein [Bacteroidia bacterium]|nr:amino acid adenylation domain-containing protein [Bacteroidia bacterium]